MTRQIVTSITFPTNEDDNPKSYVTFRREDGMGEIELILPNGEILKLCVVSLRHVIKALSL